MRRADGTTVAGDGHGNLTNAVVTALVSNASHSVAAKRTIPVNDSATITQPPAPPPVSRIPPLSP